MTKKQIREKYKQLRKSLSNKDELSEQILNRLQDHFTIQNKRLSVFVPIENLNEIDTWKLLNQSENELYFCLPKMDPNSKELTHFLYESPEQLERNTWGILEPKDGKKIETDQLDIILVPLLAYDLMGNRIGYGGGYYDRFLAQCRTDAVKIGLSFFEPENSLPELEPTDIPLDFCINPRKIYEFKR